MGEKDKRRLTILYVDDDDDTRPILRRNLVRDGYRVIVELGEEYALERAADGRVDVDLILINLGSPSADVIEAGRRIRHAIVLRTDAPIVVIADKYGADMEGRDINAGDNDWVTYLEDAEQLDRLLTRLLPRDRAAA